MIFILLLLLVLLLLIVLVLDDFDFICPEVLAIAGFLVSVVGCVLNYKAWGDITFKTVLVIMLTLITFVVGAVLGKYIRVCIYRKGTNNNKVAQNNDKHINIWFVVLMNIFMIITAVFYFRYMYQKSLAGGNPGGWQHIFTYARKAEDKVSMGQLLATAVRISFSFAYVQTYIVIQDIVYKRKNIRKNDVISMILYLIHAVLSSGRTQLLYYMVFVSLVTVVLIRNKNSWNRKSRKKTVKYIIIGCFIGLAMFWVIDQTVRGSIYGTKYTMWEQFSKYISSPIYALDIYLKNPTYIESFKGTETLYPLISILNKFGANIPFTSNALEFVSYGEEYIVSTNIYTAIRRYIHDYGYFGLIILIYFQGVIYSSFYSHIATRHLNGMVLILYGILVYPIVFYFIEERFLNDLFTLTMMFRIVFIAIFWRLAKRESVSMKQRW